MLSFICQPCKKAADEEIPLKHIECKGGTWCDCQHRVKASK